MSVEHQSEAVSPLFENAEYLARHYAELQKEFGGRWVACSGRSVRLVGDDLAGLQEQIERTCPHETLLVDFIPGPGEELDWWK